MPVHPRVTWEALCADSTLQDLPYKVETDGHGQLIMSPISQRHNSYQSRIYRHLLHLLRGGEPYMENAVQTSDGTKVADVTWAPHAFRRRHLDAFDLPVAPPICVEVLSPTNTKGEISGKRELYFERGAREVWVCDLEGKMTFYNLAGPMERSAICPKFPSPVKL